ncbi:MAG: hypothetical protein JXB13_13020 [Phycisphaerae bacterium]|nr:hypothetical protein [Phycisphaerae bacterium]
MAWKALSNTWRIPVVTMLLGLGAAAAFVAAADVEAEYQQRVQALATDDVDGHLQLALWCRDQEAWTLLRNECTHILRLVPEHQQAKLLLQLARARLGQKSEETPPGGPSAPDEAAGESTDFARVVTDEEIQTMRRIELGLGRPDRVQVRFLTVPDAAKAADIAFADEFYAADRQTRARFMKLAPAERARFILSLPTGDYAQRYGPFIQINSDPAVFEEFERGVLPIIIDGCASAQCHGGENAKGFRLFTGRRLSKNQVYTNYLILHNYKQDGRKGPEKLINRANRTNSLLLFYGLSNPIVNELTPGVHPAPVDPAYRHDRDPKYLRVLRWIEMLSVVPPEYGIDVSPVPPAPAAPQ